MVAKKKPTADVASGIVEPAEVSGALIGFRSASQTVVAANDEVVRLELIAERTEQDLAAARVFARDAQARFAEAADRLKDSLVQDG